MKEGWEYKTLGECCRISDFVSNGSFASLKQNVNYYYAKNYALLVRLADNSNNFDESKFVYTDKHGYDFTSKSHLHGGEIIMSNVGSVGSVFICPDLKIPMTLAPNTILIDTEYNRFYYYLFISPSFSSILSEIVTKTTLKKFNKTNFKKLIVRVPNSLEEQRRIVSYLDSSFKLIDEIKNKALKSLTEAKALFQSALAEAMEPKEGWEEKTLGELCSIIGGGTPSKKNSSYYNGDIPWATVSDMNCDYLQNTICKISDDGVKNSSTQIISKNEVIIATRVGLGKVCILCQDTAINQDLKGIIPKSDNKLIRKFIFWWFRSKSNYIVSNGVGATVKGVKLSFVSNLKISLPDISTQKQIVSHLDKLSSKVRAIEEKYQKMVEECDALKQAMLRDVFE